MLTVTGTNVNKYFICDLKKLPVLLSRSIMKYFLCEISEKCVKSKNLFYIYNSVYLLHSF